MIPMKTSNLKMGILKLNIFKTHHISKRKVLRNQLIMGNLPHFLELGKVVCQLILQLFQVRSTWVTVETQTIFQREVVVHLQESRIRTVVTIEIQ